MPHKQRATLNGADLRARRHDMGLTQRELAAALKVTPNTVARWERGELRIADPEHVITDLDRLQRCLEQDFAILADLLERAPVIRFDSWFEDTMLRGHYLAMRVCFHLTRGSLAEFALDALEEMWLVVAHLANQVGERSLKIDGRLAPE